MNENVEINDLENYSAGNFKGIGNNGEGLLEINKESISLYNGSLRF